MHESSDPSALLKRNGIRNVSPIQAQLSGPPGRGTAERGAAPDRGGRWCLRGSTSPGRAVGSCEAVRVGWAPVALIKSSKKSFCQR